MFCRNCGKQLGPATNFCPACGTKVIASAQTDSGNPFAGQPEVGSDWSSRTTAHRTWTYPDQRGAQILRPRAPRILGGVCSGIAIHYGWDLNLVRILTAVFGLFYGVGILAYIACWIILPEAQYALPSQSR